VISGKAPKLKPSLRLKSLQGIGSTNVEVAFASDAARVAIGDGRAETLTVYDLESGKPIWDVKEVGIVSLAISGDGTKVAALHWRGGISVWSVGQSQRQQIAGSGRYLEFSPDGERLITQNWGGKNNLVVFDLQAYAPHN
jgi:hypothetical protein